MRSRLSQRWCTRHEIKKKAAGIARYPPSSTSPAAQRWRFFSIHPLSSAGSNLSDTPTEVRWMVRVRKLWDVTSRQVTSRWCKWGGVGGVSRGVTRYKGGKWMQWEAHKTVWRHQTAGSTRLFTNDFCDVTRSRIIINASALGCSSGNVKGRLSPEQN